MDHGGVVGPARRKKLLHAAGQLFLAARMAAESAVDDVGGQGLGLRVIHVLLLTQL